MKSKEKVVLIGAGSAVFTKGLVADLVRWNWECDLALVDISDEALAVAEGLVKKMIEKTKAPITLSASTDRRDVLPGATAVICTVAVGGRRGWEQDVVIPRKYGIFQPVGDSVMPGGTSRALRMIPAMVDIAKDVLDLAPDALFFNYSNPMAPICRAIRKVTGANVAGLCHGVVGTARYLAQHLGVDLSELEYSAVGMNHLTWFVEVLVNGEDAMPKLKDIAAKILGSFDTDELGTKFAEAGTAGDEDKPVADNPFSWWLLLKFGGIPSALDRHVMEFFPQFFADGNYYGKKVGVDTFSIEATIAHGDEKYEQMRENALSKEPLSDEYYKRAGGEHEQVLEIIDSIRTGAGRIYSANLPNRGQVPNLPPEAVVESPAVASGFGVRPILQPPLPTAIAGSLATRFAWVETVVEAALEGNRDKFVQALVLDGCVDSVGTAERLADELLEAHAQYLPQFKH